MPALKIVTKATALALAGIIFLLSGGLAGANQSATVATGASVTFSVTVDGSAPFTYQWQKNGANISGATASTYTIIGAQTSDGLPSNYTVVVSNSAGSTTSDVGTLTVFNPAFTTQPISQTVATGSSVTFTAAATGSPAPTYQWQLNGINLSGATSATLTLTGVQLTDAGTYTVVATSGSSTLTSSSAVLTVQVAAIAPVITTQPVSQAITTGSSVTFTAAASGSPAPTFQWKKNGINVTGATSASLTLSNVQLSDAGTYTVLASNSAGSATSSGALLTVNSGNTGPTITTQPLSQTVTAGTSVTFTAAASGSPAPTFQWKLNGVNVSGATSASLTLTNVQSINAGSYTVVATNLVNSATSTAATLTVNGAATAPVITTQPVSQTVTVGATVTLTAAASGSPTPTFQWKKNGTNVNGATSATLTFSNIQASSAGTYKVVATNSAGSATSANAILSVNTATAPTITTQPFSQTVAPGANVTFTAAATGSPAPTYQWQLNGANISGATNATLSLSGVQLSNAGTYKVFATNSAGTASSSIAVLTVQSAPVLTSQPSSQEVVLGASVFFSAAASGTPTPTYQWQKNGVNISGATGSNYTIASTVAGDQGSYQVVATNSAGTATSNAATLAINVLPAFTTQPVSQTVTAGSSITFVAAASGTPTPTYQWQKNGVNISGATGSNYTIASTVAGDQGSYQVVATNSAGTATSNVAILSINVPPAFTTQPASQIVPAGTSVTLTFVATGTPVPTYQWQRDGVNIPGATGGTFTINTAQLTDSANYSVIATNVAGTVASNNAALTVVLDMQIAGTGDFDGDGNTDILWRRTSTGEVIVWKMIGTVFQSSSVIATVSSDWQIAGTGDFDGGGRIDDILWRKLSTGAVAVWLMNGTTLQSAPVIATVTADWQIAGTGDFDGGGRIDDILWRKPTTGAVAVWLMNGTTLQSAPVIATVTADWQIAGTGDFDGSGRVDDILWRKSATGAVGLWLLNGTAIQSTSVIATITSDWEIGGTGDFDAGGKCDDILWRKTTAGTVALWLMNGPNIQSTVIVGTAP